MTHGRSAYPVSPPTGTIAVTEHEAIRAAHRANGEHLARTSPPITTEHEDDW